MSDKNGTPISIDSVYLLPRDEQERHRLNTQHALYMKSLYEGRLIFDKQVKLADGDNVLDVGTGTGIWSVELADEYTAKIHIDAIDLNPKLFPAQHKPNITFSVASVLDLPQNWTKRFSFVNQRLLMAGLRTAEWPVAISEIFRVVKAGGSVQLIEAVSPWNPITEASEKLRNLIMAAFKENDLVIDCALKLDKFLETGGFTNIHVKESTYLIGAAAGEDGAAAKLAWLDAFRGMIPSIRKGNGFGLVRNLEEIDEIFDTVSIEWDENPVEFSIRLVSAQKPST